MELLPKEGVSRKDVPVLLLLAVGVIEFLFIILESMFSGLGYYLAETYVIVPCLLFLGYQLGNRPTAFARRRLLLGVAAASWFVLVQIIHKVSGTENYPVTMVFQVYLMAFPFAVLADDRDNKGFWWIGRMLLTASLILVGYSVLLFLGRVPAGMENVLSWDGARLRALWHPNICACFFLVGIGFSAMFCSRTEKIWAKALLLAAIGVQFLAMALTNCRTVLLMTGALLGGIVFFRIFRKGWKQLLLGLMVAAVLLVGSFKLSEAVFRWNNQRLMEALRTSQSAQQGETPAEAIDLEIDEDTGVIMGDNTQGSLQNDMRTLNGRTYIWKSALTAVWDNKTLALWGTPYSGTVVSVYNPFPVEHGHNSWVEVLLRTGLPGLLLALVFTGISVVSAAKLVLHPETEYWKKIAAMTTMCVMATGFLEPYLFGSKTFYHVIDFIFFFCTGYLDYWCHQKENA